MRTTLRLSRRASFRLFGGLLLLSPLLFVAPPAAASPDAPADPLTPTFLNTVVAYASSLSTSYPKVFAGYYFQNDNQMVVLNFVGNIPPAIQATASKDMSNVPVSFRSVSVSLESLEGGVADLQSSLPSLRAEGVSLQTFGIDNANDAIVVRVTSPDAKAERLLESAIDGLPLSLLPSPDGKGASFGYEKASSSPDASASGSPSLHFESSTTDFSPFFGKDDLGVYNSNGTTTAHFCSSGFTVKNPSGVVRATTAGHCGNRNWNTAAQTFGTSTGTLTDNKAGDIQTIAFVSGKTGFPAIWTSTATASDVLAGGSPPQGVSAICAGLSVSKKYDCGGSVEATNECVIFFDGGELCGLAEISDSHLGNGAGGAEGDSGSPIYQTISGGVRADGEFIGDAVFDDGVYASSYFAEPLPTELSLVNCTLDLY